MKAKVIGPASELGPFETLNFFGHEIGREFSDINPTADVLTKLQANRFVELKGSAKAEAKAEAGNNPGPSDDEVEEGLIRERLTELGVDVAPKAKLPALQAALEKAEKAKAAQDEEEAAVRAEAEAIQAKNEA